jgi:hypothetical protein
MTEQEQAPPTRTFNVNKGKTWKINNSPELQAMVSAGWSAGDARCRLRNDRYLAAKRMPADVKLKRKTERVTKRLFAKVAKSTEPDGCWEWTGTRNHQGYGQLRAFDRTLWSSHRLSWFLHSGAIPNGLWVLHKCDNRPCVRPDHLFLGTHVDNVNDKVSKTRQAWGEACKKKLKVGDVIEILRLRKEQVSLSKVARQFGVTKQVISGISRNKIWKQIPR